MLCLVRPKACPRCKGDLSLEFDIYGVYAECIQCGATWTKKELIPPTTQKAEKCPKAAPAKTIKTSHQR
jgi:hypothetical protein